MKHDDYVNAIKEAALSIGKQAVMRVIMAKIPASIAWLANPILGFFVGWVLTIAIKYTEFGAFYQYTDLRVGAQAKDFEEAAIKNQIAQQSGSKEEKRNAEINLIRAFDKFASLKS